MSFAANAASSMPVSSLIARSSSFTHMLFSSTALLVMLSQYTARSFALCANFFRGCITSSFGFSTLRLALTAIDIRGFRLAAERSAGFATVGTFTQGSTWPSGYTTSLPSGMSVKPTVLISKSSTEGSRQSSFTRISTCFFGTPS